MNTARAYILAGGRSSRFGSDKARALISGRPLIARLATDLRGCGREAVAVAGEAGAYDDLGVPTIADSRPGLGPLAGVESALRDGTERGLERVVIVTCDMVMVRHGWLAALEFALGRCDAAHFADDRRWMPFPAVVRTATCASVTAFLDKGGRAVKEWLREVSTACVSFPPDWPEPAQINTRRDLEAAERVLRSALDRDGDVLE